jgi:transposase-like protein
MGVYYYLINETKKEQLHFDHCVKESAIKFNEAVHIALINYMFENKGDSFTFMNDLSINYGDFTEVDLSNYYGFQNNEISQIIKEKVKIEKSISTDHQKESVSCDQEQNSDRERYEIYKDGTFIAGFKQGDPSRFGCSFDSLIAKLEFKSCIEHWKKLEPENQYKWELHIINF